MTSLNSPPSRKYPLSVMLTASDRAVVTPDSRFELGVTVHNVGDRSAIIYVFIEERTPILQQWCRSMQERLALAPDQSGEVTFQIDIPPTALPDILEYDLVIDGSDAYQDVSPRRYERYQLQVLPAARMVGSVEEPTFYLEPTSESRQPLVVQPGVGQLLQIWVDNRAERVDRFRLTCLGLPEDWTVDITYPTDPNGLGLVLEADSLGLNPGDRGQILLTLTPPLTVLAGIYIPTLRLFSENQLERNLLDLVYLQVPPTYLLLPVLQMLRSQIRTQSALFELQLENRGNTHRNVRLLLDDLEGEDSCAYTLDASELAIAPFSTQRVLLRGEPQKWWQRPLYGGGRFFGFRVRLEDIDNHPIATQPAPGNLLWLPRPWWHLLLLALIALGVAGSLLWLLWWLLLKPPVLPNLLAFQAQDSRYREENGEFARVSWDIFQSHRIQALELTGLSPDGEIISDRLTFTFEGGRLPQALQPFCAQAARQLTCTNVRTNASKPGTYIFDLTVVPRGRRPRQPIQAKTSSVVIEPAPIVTAEVVEFLPGRVVYQEASRDRPPARGEAEAGIIDANGITLSWVVVNAQELRQLLLTARADDGKSLGEMRFDFEQDDRGQLMLPEALSAVCQLDGPVLLCQNLPTQLTQVGTYTFSLTTISQAELVATADADTTTEAAVPVVAETEAVTIRPVPPAIAQFLINDAPVQPKYLIPVELGGPPPAIKLAWEVVGGATTQVELLPVPGPVQLADETILPLNPQGSTIITLQATNPMGETVSRSVQVETYNPNPSDPADVAAAAAAAATEAATAAAADSAEDAATPGALLEGLGREEALDQDRIAPLDEPPRFD